MFKFNKALFLITNSGRKASGAAVLKAQPVSNVSAVKATVRGNRQEKSEESYVVFGNCPGQTLHRLAGQPLHP